MSNKLVVLVGGSASGKDSLLEKVISKDKSIHKIVSDTSRKKREGETQGKEYNFISKDKFENNISQGAYVEHRAYNKSDEGWVHYGVNSRSINTRLNQIVILDYHGYKELKNHLESIGKEDMLVGIFIDCPSSIRLQRSLSREPEASDKQVEEMCRRLIDDSRKVLIAKNKLDITLKNVTEKDLESNVEFIINLFHI